MHNPEAMGATAMAGARSLYVKLLLRQRCVVISFHEQDEARDSEDI
jgi:hypothetical protein